jgi:integrase
LQRKGYAVATLRSVRATFSTVLEAAISHRYIEENPAHRIRLREADSRREPRYYRAPEIRRLLVILEEPCRSVVSVAVFTGLRIGEILALRWKRIDLLDGTIEVAETYSSGEFGPPKTRSSRRTIPMSTSLVESCSNICGRLVANPKGWCSRRQRAPHSTPRTCTTGNWRRRVTRSDCPGSPGTPSGTRIKRFCTIVARRSRRPRNCWGTRTSRRRSTCTPTRFRTRSGARSSVLGGFWTQLDPRGISRELAGKE